MPIIKPHDYVRVLQWLKNNYANDYPNLSFVRVTQVYMSRQALADGSHHDRVTVIINCTTKYGRTSNITWFDKSVNAPSYNTNLTEFWNNISEEFWEDRLAFDDLRDMAMAQQYLPLADQLHNAIYAAIKQAIEHVLPTVYLMPIYRRFREQASYDDEALDDINEQIEFIEQALDDNNLPVVDHVVQLDQVR